MRKCISLVALSILLTSCGAATESGGALANRPAGAVSPASTPTTHWIISLNAIDLLEQSDLTSRTLLRRAFDNGNTYIISGARAQYQLPVDFAEAIPVASFTSFEYDQAAGDGMQKAIEAHTIPAGITVAYDDENWQFTAEPEIEDPVQWTATAGQFARTNGHHFISIPGMDLGTSPTGQKLSLPQSYYSFVQHDYLNVAKQDDLFELQLENYEKSSQWATLVRQAAARVRAINAGAQFYTQLTSNPNTPELSVTQLLADYQAVVADVVGFALTIPNSTSICPACGPANVKAMLAFLQALYSG